MNFLNTKFGQWSYRNRSKILTGAGIASMWGMTVYAVAQTPKAMKAIDAKKEELKTEKLTWWETVKATWMYYVAPFCVGAGGTAMIGVSDAVQEKTISAFQSTLSLAQVAADEFKEKVKEKLSEEEVKQIETEVDQKVADVQHTNEEGLENITNTGKGEQLFYEESSCRFFRSSFDEVANDYISFKTGLDNSSGLPWNDWFNELGLSILPVGYDVGYDPCWRGYELNMDRTIRCPATGEPAVVVSIGILPKSSYK